MVLSPYLIEDCREQAEHNEDEEEHEDLGVGELVHGRPLQRSRCGVFHQLSLVARVDNEAEDPAGVPKHGSSGQDLVRTQWQCSEIYTNCFTILLIINLTEGWKNLMT